MKTTDRVHEIIENFQSDVISNYAGGSINSYKQLRNNAVNEIEKDYVSKDMEVDKEHIAFVINHNCYHSGKGKCPKCKDKVTIGALIK